jgi:hypothetical protein
MKERKKYILNKIFLSLVFGIQRRFLVVDVVVLVIHAVFQKNYLDSAEKEKNQTHFTFL